MSSHLLKAAYHLALVVGGVCEYQVARTNFHRQLVAGFVGFHVASILIDMRDHRNGNRKGIEAT